MKRLVLLVALTLIASIALAGSASANHSWSRYHWARTSNPFTIKLGDNVSGTWDSMLSTASNDWSVSAVVHTQVAAGGTDGQHCDATSGRVEVCSYNYGNTGWLGLAQIWITSQNHIVQGIVKVNDFYFGNSSYTYNNSAEMQHVVCQEIGHEFGLDHQSTSGASLDTCMDYYHNTSNTDTLSAHPNQGDYDQLLCIYDPSYKHKSIISTIGLPGGGSYTHRCRGSGHLDSYSTVGASFGSYRDAVPSFSPASRVDESRYIDRLPNGNLLVTWITWANPVNSNA